MKKPAGTTPRDDVREELEAFRQRFQLFLENVRQVYWIISADMSRVEYVSPAYETIWGRPIERLNERPLAWLDAVHPEDRAGVRKQIEDRLAGRLGAGEPTEFEYRILRPDGEVRWIRAFAYPVYDQDGALEHIAGSAEDITESARAREELHNSRRRYEIATQAARVAVWDWDLQADRVFVDPALKGFLGYAADELDEQLDTWLALLHPEDREAIGMRTKDVAKEGGDVHLEFRMMHRDGSERWFLVHGAAVRDAGGRPRRMIGTTTDITERKLAEIRLGETRGQFERLASYIPDCFWSTTVGPQGATTVRYVSPGWKTIWGREPEEIYNDAEIWLKAIVPEDLAQARAAFESTLKEQIPHTAVYRILRPAGEMRWIEDRMSPIVDASGRLVGLDGIARDITAQKRAEDELETRVRMRTAALEQANRQLEQTVESRVRAEAALRESEERFRQLAEHIGEVFWMYDPNRRGYLYVSPAYERIWGRRCQSLYEDPSSWRGAVEPDDRAKLARAIERQVEGEPTEAEYRIRQPDGTIRWIWDRGFPILDERGGVARVAGIAEDITDRREQEEILRRTERLASVGTLAAGIAHEINNPVGGILLAAQFARLKIGSTDEVLKALRDIEHDAKRCGQIVSSILRLARQDSSEKRPSCLNDVARAAIEITGSYATRHGALLRFEPAETLPDALVNDTEMEQALVNLIRNAVEAGRDGVTINVTTRVHEGNPQVVVRDNGPGLSSEQLERLFDPFYTTRRSSGGWGLGLSLTHAIVTDHRGTIEVESAPGEGAAFTIELRAA